MTDRIQQVLIETSDCRQVRLKLKLWGATGTGRGDPLLSQLELSVAILSYEPSMYLRIYIQYL